MTSAIKFCAVSDNHNVTYTIPDCDVLCVAGDLTQYGSVEEVTDVLDHISTLPATYKIVVPGNHDFLFQEYPEVAIELCAARDIILLIDSEIRLYGLNIYGSPWQPGNGNWAFNLKDLSARKEYWDKIPRDTDILITHSPALWAGDCTSFGQHLGCSALRDAVLEIVPKYHIVGHVHESHGIHQCGPITVINASLSNKDHVVCNQPTVFYVS